MLRMGFSERWVSLVMQCITIVSYAIRINGQPQGNIILSRVLRERDPLSPYLFLLYAVGFFVLIHQAVQNQKLKGISACRNGPKISHIFFADDSLIFGRAMVEKSSEILQILKVYEESSSQQLNKQKASLFFSQNSNVGTQ